MTGQSSIAEKFAHSWIPAVNGKNLPFETMYHGSYNGTRLYPDELRRQEELVSVAVDACLELVFLKQLSGMPTKELLKPEKEIGTDKWKTVWNIINEYRFDGGQKMDQSTGGHAQAMAVIDKLRDLGALKTSDDITNSDDVKNYYAQLGDFKRARKRISSQIDQLSDGLAILKADSGMSQLKEVPVHPKVIRFNHMKLGGVIQVADEIFLRDTGPKNENRAAERYREKNNVSTKMRDINRLTVVTADPKDAELFTELLAARRKWLARNAGLPEDRDYTLNEDWTISNSGCLDRKSYVALTSGFPEASRKAEVLGMTLPEGVMPPPHLEGMLGEIKIEGPMMLSADLASHVAYEIFRTYADDKKLPSAAKLLEEHREQKEMNRPAFSQLSSYYGDLKDGLAYYEEQQSPDRGKRRQSAGKLKTAVPELTLDLDKYPKIKTFEQFCDPDAIDAASSELLAFNRHIYLQAAKSHERRNAPWQRRFLEKAYEKLAETGYTPNNRFFTVAELAEVGPDMPNRPQPAERKFIPHVVDGGRSSGWAIGK